MNPLVRPLGIVASLIAACQGLAWSVLALLGILLYSGEWTPEAANPLSISYWIYLLFLTNVMEENILMTGSTLIIFISIYLFLSVVWMIISLSKLWVVLRQKWRYAKSTLIVWAVWTGLISILDLVALAFFAYDFHYVQKFHAEFGTDETGIWPYNTVAATGVMMTIAARGFVLLAMNILCAILFLIWGLNFEEEDKPESQSGFINAYDEQRPQWLGNGISRESSIPYANHSFEPDSINQKPNTNSFERNRFTTSPPPPPVNTRGIIRNNPRVSQNQPPPLTNNINNSFHNTNNRQVPRGPYIPEPDYSPTSLRKNPKSVLKTRNYY